MWIDAKHGRGCAHCEDGVSVAWFASRAGTFGLCVGCLLAWWPSKSAEWLEDQMKDYRDHIDDRLVVQLQRDGYKNVHRQAIQQPRSGDRRPGMTEKDRQSG